MFKIKGKEYYIDFDRISEYIKTDNIGVETTETTNITINDEGVEKPMNKTVTTTKVEGGIAVDNLKYEMIMQFIEMLIDGEDDEELESNLSFKFAFNTLFKLKIITLLR